MWRTYLAAVVMTTCWSCLAIAEQADIEIGVLTCALAEAPEAAPSNAPTAGGQKREGLCTFKPKKGAEETYAGTFEGVSISTDRTRTIIWVVKTIPISLSVSGVSRTSLTQGLPDASHPSFIYSWHYGMR